MWNKIKGILSIRLFEWRKDTAKRLDSIEKNSVELVGELKDLKKMLRKHGIVIEAFKSDIIDRFDRKEVEGLQPYVDMADNFFHLINSFKDRDELSTGQSEAVEIVWQKIETLLLTVGIEMIRQEGLCFDPKMHEAVESISQHCGNPVALKIFQAGFMWKGNVIRPAKVRIGDMPVADDGQMSYKGENHE
ncbi:MAG: nucleotide exchange factor GrpE [Nitrospirae bacterium]|nr:nucleotide exchange factor GrpE [Nitrospirota bacterium]